MTIADKLAGLRRAMAEKNIDTYIILSSDAHQSEYVGDYWKARAYMSGFTGSAGTLVVSADKAACWVDGRYFLQGAEQLAGTEIEMMKMGEPGVPTYEEWAIEQTPEKGTIGIDGRTVGCAQIEALKPRLARKALGLSCQDDLVAQVWTDRPSLPLDPVFELPVEYAGESREEKIGRLQEHMKKIEADYYLIASLEDSAWLLNLRGNDIKGTPVFYAYTLVGLEKSVLFIEEAKVPGEIREKLAKAQVEVQPYDALPEYLKSLPAATVACDPALINQLLMESIPESWAIIEENDKVIQMKGCKNDTEREMIRRAHVKDGAVMVRMLKWVKEIVKTETIDEVDAAEHVNQLRCEQENSLGISFGTIAGYGSNGAIVHYGPEKGKCAQLRPEGFLLLDCGGQYKEGTTDITRTIALGELTEEMKKAYTLVLKGHLALGRAVFREGTTGPMLDVLARTPLWEDGKDYKHGTGHGVGFVLGVHEGPMRIAMCDNQVPLAPGMLISNEPGYYETGEFGVRIENLIMVTEKEQTEWGKFYQMETMTLCPYEREAIVKDMLTDTEIMQINAYHERVYNELAPLLDEETRSFLEDQTRVI